MSDFELKKNTTRQILIFNKYNSKNCQLNFFTISHILNLKNKTRQILNFNKYYSFDCELIFFITSQILNWKEYNASDFELKRE